MVAYSLWHVRCGIFAVACSLCGMFAVACSRWHVRGGSRWGCLVIGSRTKLLALVEFHHHATWVEKVFDPRGSKQPSGSQTDRCQIHLFRLPRLHLGNNGISAKIVLPRHAHQPLGKWVTVIRPLPSCSSPTTPPTRRRSGTQATSRFRDRASSR